MAARFGFAEDTVGLAAALRPALATRGVPEAIYVDNGFENGFPVNRAFYIIDGLHLIPILIGMFAGAPLLARELESGTFRFAWTQGVGRTRWLAAKLVLLAIPLTLMTYALGQLFTWWLGIVDYSHTDRWAARSFDVGGSVLAAWTLLAFAIGTFAGVAIRQTVKAMAATAAASGVIPVGALAADCAHPALGVDVGSWRPRRSANDLDLTNDRGLAITEAGLAWHGSRSGHRPGLPQWIQAHDSAPSRLDGTGDTSGQCGRLTIYLADLAAIPRLKAPAAAPVKYMSTDAVDTATALESGQFNKVPVIQGINHDEWQLMIGGMEAFGAPPLTPQTYPAPLAQ
jgi:hypothetical protein